LISTADDGHFKIWDIREKREIMTYKSGEDSLCIGQFNPINANIFAVAGDSGGNISIWDMRMPKDAINTLAHHSKQVTCLEWCPTNENLLASGSDDCVIYIWD
jgi:WD40 repeat protein